MRAWLRREPSLLHSFIWANLVVMTHRTPENGDVVIREERRKGRRVYILHSVPGLEPQLLTQSRDQAIATAIDFAKRQHVCVWVSNGDEDFVLVEDFRLDVQPV